MNDQQDELIARLRRTAPPVEDVRAMGHLEAVIKMAVEAGREESAAEIAMQRARAEMMHRRAQWAEGGLTAALAEAQSWHKHCEQSTAKTESEQRYLLYLTKAIISDIARRLDRPNRRAPRVEIASSIHPMEPEGPLRCAECDCALGGRDCNWIKPGDEE